MHKIKSIGYILLAIVALMAAAGCEKKDATTPEAPAAPKDHPAH